MDLAADLGCISAEEQSFTFKGSSADKQKSDQKRQLSNALTFSDHDFDVMSNYDGNIVCQKLQGKLAYADGCSGSYHLNRKSSGGGVYEL